MPSTFVQELVDGLFGIVLVVATGWWYRRP